MANSTVATLDGDPRLILGWRKGRRTEGASVPLHVDSVPELRQVSEETLRALAGLESRPYQPSAELEVGEEYFEVPIDELPPPPRRRRTHPASASTGQDGEDLPDVADVLTLVRAGRLNELDASGLANGRFSFYGIVWSTTNGNVAFVKAANPVFTIRRGRSFFQFGNALRRTEKPDFVLYEDIDMVVRATDIIVLNKKAFDRLFSDVRVVLQDVPRIVTEVRAALSDTIPLTPQSMAALGKKCGARPTFAGRLRTLSSRIESLELDVGKVRLALERHGENPSMLLNSEDQFQFDEGNVREFLDLLEGRWFEDEFSGERRRADRYSRRH